MAKTTQYAQQGVEMPGGRVELLLQTSWGGSQRRMAADLGVSQTLISKVVRGEQAPGRKLLEALAHHGGINPSWVYEGKGDPLVGREQSVATVGPERSWAIGESMLPVARGILAGAPHVESALMTGAQFPVAFSFHRKSRYWLEVQAHDSISSIPERKVAAGDLLLMESDAVVWERNPQILIGRLCALREVGDVPAFALDRLGWDAAHRRLVRETAVTADGLPRTHTQYGPRTGRNIELDDHDSDENSVQSHEAAPTRTSPPPFDLAGVIAFVVLLVRS